MDVDAPGAGLVASRHMADVSGTPKAGADGTEAGLIFPSEARDEMALKLKLVLAVGALGPHLIQDTASKLPRGTTRSMHWSFSGSPQPVLPSSRRLAFWSQ